MLRRCRLNSYTYLFGTQTVCPGKIRFGLGICALAAIKALRETPNLWAMLNMLSPGRTV